MTHTQDLEMLYNTLKDVETKGESTKVMADCLRFIERKIRESQQEPVAPPVPPMPEPDYSDNEASEEATEETSEVTE